jgi:hypothetical protein
MNLTKLSFFRTISNGLIVFPGSAFYLAGEGRPFARGTERVWSMAGSGAQFPDDGGNSALLWMGFGTGASAEPGLNGLLLQ